MQASTRNPMLAHLDPMVGDWETESTHRLLPGTVIRGRASFEWLPGGHYLVWRESADHPEFPDGFTIVGCNASEGNHNPEDSAGECFAHSFDSRGVSRRCSMEAQAGVWRFWCDTPGFAQRFTGSISEDGRTVSGKSELCQDGSTWEEDLIVTYRRVE